MRQDKNRRYGMSPQGWMRQDGQNSSTPVTDLWTRWGDSALPMADRMGTMWLEMMNTWADMWQPNLPNTPQPTSLRERPSSRGKQQECRNCDCGCDCCVEEADLLVQIRVGEQRVVPLTLENPFRRKREVGLELSEWRTRSGKAVGWVKAELSENAFSMAPCEDKSLFMKIGIAWERDNQQSVGDVETCQVVYADLRIEGCDMRPIRVALAVLPRDCNAFAIECGCSCC